MTSNREFWGEEPRKPRRDAVWAAYGVVVSLLILWTAGGAMRPWAIVVAGFGSVVCLWILLYPLVQRQIDPRVAPSRPTPYRKHREG